MGWERGGITVRALFLEYHIEFYLFWTSKFQQQQASLPLFFSFCSFRSSNRYNMCIIILAVQLLSRVWLIATPWTAALQASLSFTISWSLLRLMSIELIMPSNRLIPVAPFSSCPQSFPASGYFPMGQLFASGDQSIELQPQSFQWIFRTNFH